MTRYRKKPVEVEAWQVGSDEPMPEWVEQIHRGCTEDGRQLFVFPNYGLVPLAPTTWLVYDSASVDIIAAPQFEQTYEAVNDAED